jgi:arsenite/tail-anchored protein-transporting ATPase
MSSSAAALLAAPTRFLLFTGKGGVGKTTLACATAIQLADAGRRVLLVSTDPASNLDEMLGVALGPQPTPVPGVPGLQATNIDPDQAAEAYRQRVLGPMEGKVPAAEVASVREQLSGACTTEIATFDRFAGLLADDEGGAGAWDHVVFDTAPTGHTLRLLELPRAWTDFLASNTRGASCLGPHGALTTRQERFAHARSQLERPEVCTVVLVTRPEGAALREAERTARELRELGLRNQLLAVNGVFRATLRDDAVAVALERRGREALASLPDTLASLPRLDVPLRGFDMLGADVLRRVFADEAPGAAPTHAPPTPVLPSLPPLSRLADALSERPHGLVMVMGKGGVGKTTLACALAVDLSRRGHRVHLSTTDPAAHVAATLDGQLPLLEVSRIDPAEETRAYTERVLERRGRELDEAGRALLREDLRSPCTEEVAVFSAFSHLMTLARSQLVVLDTAPTGHTLLLLDATGAYHRDVLRNAQPAPGARLWTPLMRLKEPDFTRVLLVTLAETTPVSEASALQEDLRRAGIEPWAWVVNASLAAARPRDPLLLRRAALELAQVERVRALARRVAVVPWRPEPPRGLAALEALVRQEADDGGGSDASRSHG